MSIFLPKAVSYDDLPTVVVAKCRLNSVDDGSVVVGRQSIGDLEQLYQNEFVQ